MLKTLLIVAFVIYGLPFFHLRYRWRATVYRVPDWSINIRPWFGHDAAALFTNRYFHTDDERRMARRFRFYVAGYVALLAWVIWLP